MLDFPDSFLYIRCLYPCDDFMLTESFLQYLRYERNYSSHTVSSYQNDLKQFEHYVLEKEGTFDPLAVEPAWVRSWIIYLMENGYVPLSVNRKLSSLKSFYRYLQKKEIIRENPLRKVSGPRVNKSLPDFVKEADMELLLDEETPDADFETTRNKMILEMFYATGMRCAELLGLRNRDVDISAYQVKVTGKRNKQRIIPFAQMLKDQITIYTNVREQEVGGVNAADDLFFIRKDGRALTHSIVYKLVRKNLSQISGLSKKSPHVLRHTFATGMLNNGADLNAVKELLGHASLSSTEVYTHTTFEELKKVYHQAHPRA